MRYESGELSGTLIDVVYDCRKNERLGNIVWVDTDLRQYMTLEIVGHHAEQLLHTTGIILVLNRVIYINSQPARPLPNVDKYRRKSVKPWPGRRP